MHKMFQENNMINIEIATDQLQERDYKNYIMISKKSWMEFALN